MRILSLVQKLLNSSLRKAERSLKGRRSSLGHYLFPVTVALFSCATAQAEIELIKVGNPLWEPIGFATSTFPLGTTDTSRYNEIVKSGALDALGANHGEGFIPGVPHEAPYDTEFQHALAESGFINTDIFLPGEIAVPNIVMTNFVIVPSENAPLGASNDFTHGPILPEEIFPISKVSARRITIDGVAIGGVGTPRLIGDLGDRSHLLVNTWRARFPGERVVGEWEIVNEYRDATGNGWDTIETFNVVQGSNRMLGDLNYNGELDMGDYNILKQNVDVAPAGQPSRSFLRLDMNDDNLVDAADTSYWAGMVDTPEAITLSLTSPYLQDFDSLGSDGAAEVALPAAWTVTDKHGMPRLRETNVPFPASVRDVRSVSQPIALNAGDAEGDKVGDRSLAIFKPRSGEETAIQLLADTVTHADALQLNFSIEAWDRIWPTPNNRDGGEARFDVTVEIDTSDGTSDISKILGGEFTELLSLGTITTGAVLPTPDGDFLDGNDPAHRHVFSSDVLHADIPAGSRLRFRWKITDEADASEEWIFGIDDVSITLAVAGDTNLDGEVKFDDFLALSNNFGQTGGWEQGDFDGNGEVNFPDFLALSANFSGAANNSAAAVPEPTGTVLAIFGLLGLIGFRKRR